MASPATKLCRRFVIVQLKGNRRHINSFSMKLPHWEIRLENRWSVSKATRSTQGQSVCWQPQATDCGVRSNDPGLASLQPDKQTSALYSRVGPMLATALVASAADPSTFRSARNFSAWIGLVPKQYSSGGKERLGSISKQGDRYLRSLFVVGALAVIRYAKIHGTGHRPWLTALLARKPAKVAAIALANKMARMAWAMMARGERYKAPAALAR
jgi:Transposase IS116/IS110/IS902 family